MVAALDLLRKFRRHAIALSAVVGLAACDPVVVGGSGPVVNTREAVPVALLLPQSAANGASLSQSFENAARLAMADLGGDAIDLRVYNTQGTPDGAAAAANAAVVEGAKIILGPVFGDAAAAAAPSGVPWVL